MTLTCKKNKNPRLITGNDTCVEKSKIKNESGTYRGHLKKGKYDGKGRSFYVSSRSPTLCHRLWNF